MQSDESQLTFQKNILASSSGSKSKPGKKPARSSQQTLKPRRQKRHVLPKSLLTFLIATAMRTSNPLGIHVFYSSHILTRVSGDSEMKATNIPRN
jgi:hypothetical protein